MKRRASDTLNVSVIIARPLRTAPDLIVSSLAGGWFDLCEAVRKSPITLTKISPPTLESLRGHLASAKSSGQTIDVLQFSGTAYREGLEFEDELGKVDQISAKTLVAYMKAAIGNSAGLGLCLFRTSGATEAASSIAEALIDNRIARAVVFDESEATDEEAMNFAASIYQNLISHIPLCEAIELANSQGGARPASFGERDIRFRIAQGNTARLVDARPAGSIDKRLIFLGRETVLIDLARRFQDAGGLTMISGIPGIGKTALVTEAMHRAAWRFPGGVTAIALPQDGELAKGVTADAILAGLMRDLSLSEQPQLGVRAVLLSHFKSNRALVFLDNIGWLLAGIKGGGAKTKEGAEALSLMNFLEEASNDCHIVLAARDVGPSMDKWLQKEGALQYLLTDGLEPEAGCRLVMERALNARVSSLQQPKAAMELATAARFHPKLIEIVVPQAKRQNLKQLIAELEAFVGENVEPLGRMIDRSLRKLPKRALSAAQALTLFPGGSCSFDEMKSATGGDDASVLTALKALELASLVAYTDSEQRYRWHASVFECARRLPLGSFDFASARDRLIGFYSRTLPTRIFGSQGADPEVTNLLLLLEGSSKFSDLRQVARDVVNELDPVLHVLGRWTDSKKVVRHVLALCEGNELKDVLSGLLDRLACACQALGDYDQAFDYYKRSLALSPESAGTMHGLGRLEHDRANQEEAEDWYERSLNAATKINDDRGVARVMHDTGRLAHLQGKMSEAQKRLTRSLELRQGIVRSKRGRERWDSWDFAATCHELGSLEQTLGNLDRAKDLYEQSYKIRKSPEQSDRRGRADTLHALGSVWLERGQLETARKLFGKSVSIKRELLDSRGAAATLTRLAEISVLKDDASETAHEMYEEAITIQSAQDTAGLCYTLNSMAKILYERAGRYEEARARYDKSLRLSGEKGFPFSMAVAQLGLARIDEATEGDVIAGLARARRALDFFEPRKMPQQAEALHLQQKLEAGLMKRLRKELPHASLEEARDALPMIKNVALGETKGEEQKAGQRPSFRGNGFGRISPSVRKVLEIASPLIAEMSLKMGAETALEIYLKAFGR